MSVQIDFNVTNMDYLVRLLRFKIDSSMQQILLIHKCDVDKHNKTAFFEKDSLAV